VTRGTNQRGGKRWRSETNGSLDEIEFGLDIRDASKLHIKDRLLLCDLPHLCADQVSLLTDFRLERFDSQGQ
jgi:hypothetical protein